MKVLGLLAAAIVLAGCAKPEPSTPHQKLTERLASEGVDAEFIALVENRKAGGLTLCGWLRTGGFVIFTNKEELVRNVKPPSSEWQAYCGKGGPFPTDQVLVIE